MSVVLDLRKHPCFSDSARGVCGRVHLPVAPKCNIKCNYCDRRHDCVNESRPGVASAVLSPVQAVRYVEGVLVQDPRISVVGIAGPGDPLANPEETGETLARIQRRYPELLLCLSTNGLALPRHLDDLARFGVSHVTVTVNAVDPEVGEKVYGWVRDGKTIYRGRAAAEVLLERQLEGIRGLVAQGAVVKVNTIVIPGVNDGHVSEVARTVADWGVAVLNCMAMVPNVGTPFEDVPEPSLARMAEVRRAAERFLPQMNHCQRCRADAVGLLDDDRSAEFRDHLEQCADTLHLETADRPYVAVASLEGLLVNQHLGEARTFQVWVKEDDGFTFVEEREAPPKGGGVDRWRALAEILRDCRAILVSSVGPGPRAVLAEEGVPPVEMSGFVELGLQAVYAGEDLSGFRRRRAPGTCSQNHGCEGDGLGCG